MSADLVSPQSSKELTCYICYYPFDKSSKIPLIVCARSHQMCSECVKAIRKSKRCPFCRENIDLQSIKINKQIVRKLVGNPNEPNIRHQILQQSNFYISPLPSEDQNQPIEIQARRNLRPLIRKGVYLTTVILLFPLIIFDFYSGFIDIQHPQCYKSKRLLGFLTLEIWFKGKSLSQAISLLILIVLLFKHICENYRQRPWTFCLEHFYVSGLLIKGVISCIVEMLLYFRIILANCGGHIYRYGTALTIIHSLEILYTIARILKFNIPP